VGMRAAPLSRELCDFVFISKPAMKATSFVLRYTAVLAVGLFLLALYLWAAGVRFFGHRPHWIVGQALGAHAAIRGWMRFNLWLVGLLSRPVHMYLAHLHPRLADWLERGRWF
jgi:hypothetical protein